MALPKWLVAVGPVRPARPLLVCAPYAGGGAAIYRGLRDLSDVVDVYSVRYPGRESRLQEAPLTSIDALVAGLVTELEPLWRTRPIVLFGHSLGASVAFETARAMRRLGAEPLGLIVSGRGPPTMKSKDEPIAHLPRAEFLAELRELAGTPPEFFAHEELIDLLLPVLRADFAAAEQYRARAEPPLECPLIVYCGRQDDATPEDMAAWQEQTRGAFTQRTFDGGHFFLHEPGLLVTALRDDLQALLT